MLNLLLLRQENIKASSFPGLTGESIRGWMLRSSRSMTFFVSLIAVVIKLTRNVFYIHAGALMFSTSTCKLGENAVGVR